MAGFAHALVVCLAASAAKTSVARASREDKVFKLALASGRIKQGPRSPNQKDEELSDKLGQTTDSSYSLSASQALGSNVSMSDRMGSSTETGATDHVEELLHAPAPVPVDPNMHLAKLPSFLGCHPGLQKSVRVDFSNTTGLTYHAYRATHAAIQLEAVENDGVEVTKHRGCLDYIGLMLHYRAIVSRIRVAKI